MTKLYSSQSAEHLMAVKELITANCSDPSVAEIAYFEIVSAIEVYRQVEAPLVDGKYRGPAASTSVIRQELRTIAKQVAALSDSLQNMSIGTLSELADAMDQPLGCFKQAVHTLYVGATEAEKNATRLENKPADPHRTLMARDIAAAMDKAGLKITKTVPSERITGKRSGAIYGRVLQAACLAAGLHSVNLGPLISKGVDMLKAPMP